jgi:chemotaxis protein methyltransferase CheR
MAEPVSSITPPKDADYEFIREVVYKLSRISLGPQKQTMVISRIAKRMRLLKLNSVKEYCEYLRKPSGRAELSSLIDAISTNHTYFFREAGHFDYLTREILAKQQGPRRKPFLVWSSACSSGEEPYSVAMILEEQRRIDRGFDWRMEATDISSIVLKKAQDAIYPVEALERVPEVLHDRYFRDMPEPGKVAVLPEVKRRIHFRRLNLFEIPQEFPGPFDLILCCNVMIYFDRQTREQLVDDLTDRLQPTGTLFVGHSESLGGIRHRLRMVRPAIYVKASS